MKNTIAERIVDFLKKYPPFDILDNEQLNEVSINAKIYYFEKDNYIFKQLDEGHEVFYIVKEGAVGIYREIENDSILLDICDEGDVFGLRPLIQEDTYKMNAIANEESIVYGISIEILKDLIKTNDKVDKYLKASFSTNIKTPYSDDNSALFGGVDSLQNNSANFSDIQTIDYSKDPIVCSPGVSIKEAAQLMTAHKVGSIIITQDKLPIGIITDKDLRMKVATGIVVIEESVNKIMSSPIITYSNKISVAEAHIAMIRHKITHLCITKDGTDKSELIGLVSEHDIVIIHGNNPTVLIKEIERSISVNAIKNVRIKASRLLENYLKQNVPINFASKIFAEINQSIINTVISMSLAEMNDSPPVKFSWLSLGSMGRKEQLLLTDQDNALIFENVNDVDYKHTKSYFLSLSKLITQKLDAIGYVYCPADMMASNPKWCLSLDEWKNQFGKWIHKPTEQAILNCTIFFDFNCVYGDKYLVHKLSESIFKSIHKNEIFLNFLGRNAMLNPAPIGFFKQFLIEHDGEHKNQFDIKARGLMPMIDAARLLTLSLDIESKNNTIERFEALIELEPQNKDLYLSCIDSFKILLRYRTTQGVKNNDSGRYVDLSSLSKAEKMKLKACFKPLKSIQEVIVNRFKVNQLL